MLIINRLYAVKREKTGKNRHLKKHLECLFCQKW